MPGKYYVVLIIFFLLRSLNKHLFLLRVKLIGQKEELVSIQSTVMSTHQSKMQRTSMCSSRWAGGGEVNNTFVSFYCSETSTGEGGDINTSFM